MLCNEYLILVIPIRLAMTSAPMPPKIQTSQSQPRHSEYNKNSIMANANGIQAQRSNDNSAMLNLTSEHIYSSGPGGVEQDPHNTSMPVIQFGQSRGHGPLPPPPVLHSTKPGWTAQPNIQQEEKLQQQAPFAFSPSTPTNRRQNKEEEAIPSDSLYGGDHHQPHPADAMGSQKTGNLIQNSHVRLSTSPINS